MAKRIGAIVSLCLIGVLVVATIVLANMKVNNNIKYNKPSEVSVIYKGQTESTIRNAEHANKVVKLMQKATEESFLTALFNKTLDEKAELKHYKSTAQEIAKNNNGFYVIFTYDVPQKYTYNGTEYYYIDLVFTVNETDGEQLTKVYISEDGTLSYSKYYELNVDYSEVFNYLTAKGYQN